MSAMFDADARALMLAQEGELRAWGFDYKTQQEGNVVNEQELWRRNQLIDSIRELGSKLSHIQSTQGTVQTASLRPPSQPPTIDGEVA
jgi:hypothetical protein